MYRRLVVATLVGCVGLALTGCTQTPAGNPPPGPTSAAPSDLDVVRHSADLLATTPYHYESVHSPGSPAATTTVSDADRVRRVSRTVTTTAPSGPVAATRFLGDDGYVSLNGTTFTHVNLTRLRAESLTRAFQYESAEVFMPAVTSASATGPRAYRGTIDLRISTAQGATPALRTLAQTLLAPLSSSTLDFTATVDEQGRLLTLSYTRDLGLASGPLASTITISRYGEAVTVERPPTNLVTEATEQLYAIM